MSRNNKKNNRYKVYEKIFNNIHFKFVIYTIWNIV